MYDVCTTISLFLFKICEIAGVNKHTSSGHVLMVSQGYSLVVRLRRIWTN
ncbi:MAG: hypothetical protein OJF51_000499 [Nitrospira sp.]|nr:MAG: hypothetical protein OJF51_000499 [Nitrospira sp.]